MNQLPDETQGDGAAVPMSAAKVKLPAAARWLGSFQLMNGFNYSMVQGTPMVLVAKYLGAGEALVGILLGLTPFMCMSQLFAGRKADLWGYQRMMLAGWLPRFLALVLLIPLPLLHGQALWGWRVPDNLLVGLLVALVCVYTAIRSFTFNGWIPWLSRCIPEAQRGRYFGVDQAMVSGGMLLSLVISAMFLGNDVHDIPSWKYAMLMALSLGAYVLGLRFLRRIPDGHSAEPSTVKDLDWRGLLDAGREIWQHEPFRRMLAWMAVNHLAWGAYGGFTVVFMRDQLHIAEGNILGLSGINMLGILASSVFWGRFSDAFGSRPVMRLAGAGQLLVLSLWLMMAAGWITLPLVSLYVMHAGFGMITAAMAVPFLKLFMASFPERNRTVAITLNTSIASIFAGLSPLVWGLALEQLQHVPDLSHGWLRPFTIFFGSGIVLTVAMQILLSRIRRDHNLATVEVLEHLVITWPRQRLFGLINGLFAPSGYRGKPEA